MERLLATVQNTDPEVLIYLKATPEGALLVSGFSGGGSSGGLTNAELRATPLPTKDANGAGAVRYTTDTTAVTGSFAQIMCLTATTFSLLTRTGATGSLAGIALPAGTLLIGPFTAYTLTSGAVAAYA